ncbi:MAG TPA: cbb3-type cytochrome oxidase assembly protein CcoS [Gallionellaceae bacterium]|nr:cbb3-type cytochrome oxidase assembly protein CcoS [Gallionellaceae bacterium]
MEVIYSLIPGMTFLGLVMVGVLIWAIRRGQYEDMEGNASRILLDDDEDALVVKQEEREAPKESAPDEPGKP